MEKNELRVLVLFLKAGYSTRAIDQALGLDSNKTKGFISWKILKKYNLQKQDLSKLFIYKENEVKKIIKEMIIMNTKGSIDKLIEIHKPSNISKYYNTFFICESEDKLCKAIVGETKNIIQYFFNGQKKIVGKCQNRNCKIQEKTEIHTAHYTLERPEIFKNSAIKFRKKTKNLYSYDLYKIFEDYLKSHSKKKSICFLCLKCHTMFDNKIKRL